VLESEPKKTEEGGTIRGNFQKKRKNVITKQEPPKTVKKGKESCGRTFI